MTSAADTNPEYWAEYTNLQQVKHDLIRCYLGGWFAKLGFWAGRVVYLDTHAGRGSYASGHLGSPLVALDTLLNHGSLHHLLKKSEFRFLFIERDPQNLELLKNELSLRAFPKGVHVEPHCGDAFVAIDALIKKTKSLAPAFAFVDPYGFKVPGAILREFLNAGRVELFINVIWRELNMAICQAQAGRKPGLTTTLNDIFDGQEWIEAIDAEDVDERAEQAVRLLARKIGARWHTYIRMLGDNRRTRYILLHLTNHADGRDLMKECIWKIAPDGGYFARKSVDPGQLLLITPSPDLEPLRDWVLRRLQVRPMRWLELHDEVRSELWRKSQLNQIVRDLRSRKIIEGTDYKGSFAPKANPLLCIRH